MNNIPINNSRVSNNMNHTIKYLIIVSAYSNFFGLINNNTVLYLLNGYFILYSLNKFYKCKEKFPLMIFFGCIVSMISCSYIRHQSIMQSIAVNHTVLSIISFYYFYDKRIQYKSMINGLQLYFVVWAICYILQVIAFPTIIFPCAEANMEFEMTSDKYKFFFPGLIIIHFAFFYNLNRYLDSKKKSFLFMAILAVLMMVFRVSRLHTVIFVFLAILFIYSYFGRINLKLLVLLGIFAIAAGIMVNSSAGQEIFGFMLEKQENETFTNDDYVRNLSLAYFYTDFFQNNFEMITGAGLPNVASQYGRWIEDWRGIRTGYVDWGILGQSWMLGIITAIGFLLMWIKPVLKYRYDKTNKYCQYFFIYTILISILAITAFLSGSVVIQVMIYVIASQLNINKICQKN